MEIAKLVLEYMKVLIWPCILVFLSLYFNAQIAGIFERLQSAKLPGGISIVMSAKIQEVQRLSTKVQAAVSQKKEEHKDIPYIPLNEVNSRLIELGFRPSPSGMDMDYYRDIAKNDPNLSLAGLRIEVDILAKNLAKGFNVHFDDKNESSSQLLRKLLDSGSITNDQYQLATKVLSLCNKAVRGVLVSQEQALSIIDSADVLIEDYLSWMSWGFDDSLRSSSSDGISNLAFPQVFLRG